VLEVQGLDAAYGDVPALSGVTLRVGAGEIVALLGPNGAGKSTLLGCVAGLVRPRAGTITWDGRENLLTVAPHLIVEHGLAVVPEGRRLFGAMTVEDNLDLGAFSPRARAARRESLERVFTLFPDLRARRRQTVRALSGGQQQMVAVGRALMASPRLLMLDEPSLGLDPKTTAGVFGVLRRIREMNVAVLIVEQDAVRTLQLADRAYVLESGEITLHGTGADLLLSPALRSAYLGL
jgi:branched-chain amino acid transport system ATP-binding protein